jgi:uncharacterized protein YjiS (DUF1127 family)
MKHLSEGSRDEIVPQHRLPPVEPISPRTCGVVTPGSRAMNISNANVLAEIRQARVLTAPTTTAGILPSGRARSPLSAILDRLLLWQERATQRHRLMTMEDHRLRDMGLTRAAVAHEINKPFWRL